MPKHLSPILAALTAATALFTSPAQADSTNFQRHQESRFGIEVNLVWPIPPISTYELKLLYRVGPSTDLVVGYGRQAWTIGEGAAVNPGAMDSHALILGVKQEIARTSALVEYDVWIAHDSLRSPDGKVVEGWSISNEFFAGYQFYVGNSRATITPGLNAGFWSYKSYVSQQPKDDRFVWTVLPKVMGGYEFTE